MASPLFSWALLVMMLLSTLWRSPIHTPHSLVVIHSTDDFRSGVWERTRTLLAPGSLYPAEHQPLTWTRGRCNYLGTGQHPSMPSYETRRSTMAAKADFVAKGVAPIKAFELTAPLGCGWSHLHKQVRLSDPSGTESRERCRVQDFIPHPLIPSPSQQSHVHSE